MISIINENAHVTLSYALKDNIAIVETNLKGVTYQADGEPSTRQDTLRQMYQVKRTSNSTFPIELTPRSNTHEVFVKGRRSKRSCGFVTAEVSCLVRKLSRLGILLRPNEIVLRKHVVDNQHVFGISLRLAAKLKPEQIDTFVDAINDTVTYVEERNRDKGLEGIL